MRGRWVRGRELCQRMRAQNLRQEHRKTSGCRHVSSGAEFSAAMGNLNPTTATELGGSSGSTRWNGGTEHERRRHGGDALRADRPAEWPASPAWRSLRLISVAPFLRVEPFPPSSPLTRGPHSVVRGKPWRPCSAGTRRRCRRTHARWRDPSARRNHSSAR